MRLEEQLVNEFNLYKEKNTNIMLFTNLSEEDKKYGNHPEYFDALYEIGSSSKMFASTSIFLLQERGLLNIDDPISKYLSTEYSDLLTVNDVDYSMVSIKSVLNHSSGLGDHINSGDDEKVLAVVSSHKQPFSFEEIMDMGRKNTVQKFIKPYSEQAYSNIGYILIGKIIEFVTKTSYKEFIRENIFKPLNMNDSLFISDNSSNPKILNGTYKGLPSNFSPSLAQAAGEIISSLDDMKKFLVGVFSGNVISQESLAIIYKSVEVKESEKNARHFGYGFYKEDGFIGHAGQTFGFLTKAFYRAEDNKFIILSQNDAVASEEFIKIIEILKNIK